MRRPVLQRRQPEHPAELNDPMPARHAPHRLGDERDVAAEGRSAGRAVRRAGLVAGLSAWALIADPEINWFVGNVTSLCLPILLMLALTPLHRRTFDFRQLSQWRPAHWRDDSTRPLPEDA